MTVKVTRIQGKFRNSDLWGKCCVLCIKLKGKQPQKHLGDLLSIKTSGYTESIR